jgi:hypothetical protein
MKIGLGQIKFGRMVGREQVSVDASRPGAKPSEASCGEFPLERRRGDHGGGGRRVKMSQHGIAQPGRND